MLHIQLCSQSGQHLSHVLRLLESVSSQRAPIHNQINLHLYNGAAETTPTVEIGFVM